MEDETAVKSELKECSRCGQLESKCLELESEIEKKRTQYEKLEAKFRKLDAEKNVIEEELKALKREKKGNEMREREGIVDLTGEGEGEEDGAVQLMIENSVLVCEKRRAESEVEFLKHKLKELESRVFNDTTVTVLQTAAGTPCNETPKHITSMDGEKVGIREESEIENAKQVSKHLTFEEDRSPSKKMAPSTPSGARIAPSGIIDICDSDGEPDVTHLQPMSVNNQGGGNTCISTDHLSEGTVGREKGIASKGSSKRVLFQHSYELKLDNCNDVVQFICTPKRKRASNIVTSDTESDDDDLPICKLKRMNCQEIVSDQSIPEMKSCSATASAPEDDNIENLVTPPRRRLVSLRQCRGKGSSSKRHEINDQHGIPTTEDIEDNESEDAGSDSGGDSLNDFIVESTEDSDGDDASSEGQDDSDDNLDFKEILSRLKRSKDQTSEWEFEADMLAAFGKDPKLCMKAVCVLYRQQTSEEKVSRGSLVNNYRGFSKFDARRGTTLAEFLTDGDPEGDLKKSVKELQEYDPRGVEMCRTFATRYSKQLFEIYKNKEDPHFP